MYTRIATQDDALEVRRILDAAMLEPGDVESRIDANDVFVAGDRWPATRADHGRSAQGGGSTRTESDDAAQIGREESTDTDERILGAIVLEPLADVGEPPESAAEGAHVSAIGVRRRHRGRGIGRALIERALEREGRLTAHFDAGVRPFYESLEFSIEAIDDERYRGSLAGPR
ncbi:GCN5 family acetyltransferase [Halostagnicola larsenii XH-48]|uniref:GCN5 family acetyltransferase n=1 Tax=Halostagnicola larsenii XH-48 TaxID=797299 RepID=W0JTG6_9EURY|nr:GNAT family N-acetyltransferase [Halostagnicola larsenii]AHG00607.1 GCN5 family acetyltransferase [Halostagnicola larsenii XH-48]